MVPRIRHLTTTKATIIAKIGLYDLFQPNSDKTNPKRLEAWEHREREGSLYEDAKPVLERGT